MKRYCSTLAVIIFLIIIALSGCSGVQRSIRPGVGPAIEGGESEDCSRIISHYYTIKCCIVDGRKEVWVESNFLSENYLKNLAIEIANFCSVDLIVPLYYPNGKSYKLFVEKYLYYTYFVYSDYIEVKTETNTLLGGMKAVRTEKFYNVSSQELIPTTVKRGYSVILEKNRNDTLGLNFLKPSVSRWFFFFDKPPFLS